MTTVRIGELGDFTPEARSAIVSGVQWHGRLLVADARRLARRERAELVMLRHVQRATRYTRTTPTGMTRVAELASGLCLGTAAGHWLTMASRGYSDGGVALLIALALAGLACGRLYVSSE